MFNARVTIINNGRHSSRIDPTAITHRDLLHQFTGHLVLEDFLYYNKWTSLLDLEAKADCFQIAETWLYHSSEREASTSKTISALVFDDTRSSDYAHYDISWYSIIAMIRSPASTIQAPLCTLGFENGSRIVISTDSHTGNRNTLDDSNMNISGKRQVTRKMYLVRGIVHSVSKNSILILASKEDHLRLRNASRSNDRIQSREVVSFRIDKDETAYGFGTLRQNLINLFTGDAKEPTDVSPTYFSKHRFSGLRDLVVRFRSPIFEHEKSRSMFKPLSLSRCLSHRYLKRLETEFSLLNPDQKAAVAKVRINA
jgi:hypothetical protein